MFDGKTGREMTCHGATYSLALSIRLGNTVGTNGNCAGCSADAMTTVNVTGSDCKLNIELSRDFNSPDQTMLALASATDSSDSSLSLGEAAQRLGFDHFNWMQIIVTDLQLKACADPVVVADPVAAAQCNQLQTMRGTVPGLPTVDPPAGGWTYQYWNTECRGSTCSFNYPVADNWPMYYDEFFGYELKQDGDDFYERFVAPPAPPGYRLFYQSSNRLMKRPATFVGVDPQQAFGFLFTDTPGTAGIKVPGSKTDQTENITFITSLVGVTGACHTLNTSGCSFQIIPGTTFQWMAAKGMVNYQPLTFTRQHVGFPIVNPIDLTGSELTNAIISVDQFLALGNLTPQSLAAMGGSVAPFSASLIPGQAAALASAAKVIPSTLIRATASGLAYNRVTQTFDGTMTITNTSSDLLNGPFQIVFASLPDGVTLVNATGTDNQLPYLTVNMNSLGVGQSATVNLKFSNPSNTIMNSIPVVYSGTFN